MMTIKAVALVLLVVMGQECDIDLGDLKLDELIVTHQVTVTNQSTRDALVSIEAPDVSRQGFVPPGGQLTAKSYATGRGSILVREGDELRLDRERRGNELAARLGDTSLTDDERDRLVADLKTINDNLKERPGESAQWGSCAFQLETRDDGTGTRVTVTATWDETGEWTATC